MRGATDGEATEYLRSLPGVGPKTAAVVLAFALGRATIPVDTHVHRVSKRLGLVPAEVHRRVRLTGCSKISFPSRSASSCTSGSSPSAARSARRVGLDAKPALCVISVPQRRSFSQVG